MANVFGNHTLGIPYRPVADLLAEYRARDPGKTAIVDLDGGSSITFGDLDRVTTDIAAGLKRRGVRKGSRVLLLSDENLEKLLIWLGVWRIGAVVCPINIEINQKHMAEVAAALDPALILYHKDIDCGALVGDARAPRLRFGSWNARDPQDELFANLTSGSAADLPERNNADDPACIFCTSGTTARPKIVLYDHAAYWLNGLDTLEFLGLTADDRTLEYRSFGWNSAQVLSLMPFLQKGLTLHIAKKFSHSHFSDWIGTHGITFAAGVPTVLNMLLNRPIEGFARKNPTLRLMSCSTAPLTAQQWEKFEDMYGAKLLQLYGMSETGWVCGNRHYTRKLGTVGLPALHQELEIVDGAGNPCAGRRGRRDHRRRPADGDRLYRRRRRDRAGARQAHQDRRSRHPRRRRLHPRHRPRQGHHHPRRRQHRAAGDRRGAAPAPGHSRCRRGRRAGPDLRRGGGVLRGRQGDQTFPPPACAPTARRICRPPSARSRSSSSPTYRRAIAARCCATSCARIGARGR